MPLKLLRFDEETSKDDLLRENKKLRRIVNSALDKVLELASQRQTERLEKERAQGLLDLCTRFLIRLDQNQIGGQRQLTEELGKLLSEIRRDS